VSAAPREHAGPVLKGVRRNSDLRIAEWRELAIEVRHAALDDLLSDRRDLVQPLLDRARHDAPPENKKPPDLGRLRAAVVLALAARASRSSSRKELAENNDDERSAHENANARRWLFGSQGHTRPITSSRCHTRRASSTGRTAMRLRPKAN